MGSKKEYRCQGMKSDGTHTRFWESDRTKSTFDMLCLPDGTFQFEDKRSNWPTCLEGEDDIFQFSYFSSDIICKKYPPKIPTHTEYTLISDDGTVDTNSLSYPSLQSHQSTLNSTMQDTDIPRNYMANLT